MGFYDFCRYTKAPADTNYAFEKVNDLWNEEIIAQLNSEDDNSEDDSETTDQDIEAPERHTETTETQTTATDETTATQTSATNEATTTPNRTAPDGETQTTDKTDQNTRLTRAAK